MTKGRQLVHARGHGRQSMKSFRAAGTRETIALAETLGGRLLRESFVAATGQTLGVIVDPEGNRVVLVQQ